MRERFVNLGTVVGAGVIIAGEVVARLPRTGNPNIDIFMDFAPIGTKAIGVPSIGLGVVMRLKRRDTNESAAKDLTDSSMRE